MIETRIESRQLKDFSVVFVRSIPLRGSTLIEVMVAAAVVTLVVGIILATVIKCSEMSKWQSDYQAACSYGEQALEYAIYVPYSDLSLTNYTPPSPNWVSNGLLVTRATSTNYINTTQMGGPYTLTNITYLATEASLPLDDLGNYIVSRNVAVTDRSVIEPGAINVDYKLITVSNSWVFLGRTMPPIVYQVIRDAP